MRDYHCFFVNNKSTVDLEKDKLYLISKYFSYDHLSQKHKECVLTISVDTGPKSYKIAPESEAWQKALKEELKVLETNRNWKITYLIIKVR